MNTATGRANTLVKLSRSGSKCTKSWLSTLKRWSIGLKRASSNKKLNCSPKGSVMLGKSLISLLTSLTRKIRFIASSTCCRMRLKKSKSSRMKLSSSRSSCGARQDVVSTTFVNSRGWVFNNYCNFECSSNNKPNTRRSLQNLWALTSQGWAFRRRHNSESKS